MECIFLNAAGQTLFVRDDMESGHWIQQEMNVTADFPFVADKKIERGMRIAFRDPETDVMEVFEVRVVMNQEPDHYQQITAEHICVAELLDEHIDTMEITAQTASQALSSVLSGTLWSVGTVTASGTQSADIGRGAVWDAVNTIQQNWNVYITPRVVISSAGAITGRYLDIAPAEGVWRGLRLSIRKNMLDPSVTYDDEDVYTALYGYGGNVEKAQSSGDDKTEELNFAGEVWTATSDHPAKPAGQTYLEWPEKTAIYGRNGRARFGYYQNSNIKDAAVLLQKTWESLKLSCEPKISVAGGCVDLYRLGYKDQPLRLHDLAIVEIEETGETFQKQIITCDIDLIDPTGTRVQVGDYIPNIVYINRDTDNKASRGGGGGGGGRSKGSMTNLEDEDVKTFTEFIKTNEKIGMVVGTKDGDNYIKGGEIALSINSQTGETKILLQADIIDMDGVVEALEAYDIACGGLRVEGQTDFLQGIYSEARIYTEEDVVAGTNISAPNGKISGANAEFSNGLKLTGGLLDVFDIDCDDIDAFDIDCHNITASSVVSGASLRINGSNATWRSQEVVTAVSKSNSHYFLYTSSSTSQTASGSVNGTVVTSVDTATIHYLGGANT